LILVASIGWRSLKVALRRVTENGSRASVAASREPAATGIAAAAFMFLCAMGAFGFALPRICWHGGMRMPYLRHKGCRDWSARKCQQSQN
jgi:hypothetical protein